MRFVRIVLLAGVLLCAPVFISAQESTPEAVPTTGLTIHVVQRGENLFRIALQYGLTTEEMAQLNGILDVNSIQVGQRLLVPSEDQTKSLPETHTVQAGESLAAIAELYQVDVETLIRLNNLTNPNQIYSGQVLSITTATITPEASETPDSPTPVLDEPVINTGTVLHTVQEGETLFRIALQYGLNVQQVAVANSISDPTRIFAGQQLIIPINGEVAELALDLPAPITGLQISPQVMVEGETGSIQIQTSEATQITGTFLNQTLNGMPQADNLEHIILFGIPAFTAGGVYPVTLNIVDAGGTTTQFSFNLQVLTGGYATQNLNVSAEMQGLLAPEVQANELSILTRITTIITPEKAWDGLFGIPAAAAMNASYGTRRSYNGGDVNTFHTGADFASAPNTPIYAAAPGRVVLADALNIRGNTVVLDHGWGVYTVYAHQTTINVALGDVVTTGQVIGFAGSSGRVTGPHLHWEVWINGVPVNPIQWTQRVFP